MVPAWFQRVVLHRVWLSFVVLGLSFFGFGAGSLNLFYLLRANTALVLDNGWMALADGGAQQLVELLSTGYLSMASYVVFKACEYRLAHWLADPMADAAPGGIASTRPDSPSSDSFPPTS